MATAKNSRGCVSGSQFSRKSQLSILQKVHGVQVDGEKAHGEKLDGEELDDGAACCLSSPYVTERLSFKLLY